MPWRSRQEARSDLPPKVHTCYLVPLISPWILNRFSRFRRRCDPFEKTFSTMYNTARYSQGISRKSMKTKTRQVPDLVPQSTYRDGSTTVVTARIKWIFWDRYDKVWKTSEILSFNPTSFHIGFCMSNEC